MCIKSVMMRKVHEINGVSIYESELGFDGFFIEPSEALKADSETLEVLEAWCREHHKAHYAAYIFADLGYRFDSQFMDVNDLDLIAEVFVGEHIGNAAASEKLRILRGEGRPTIKETERRRVGGYVYLVEGEGEIYKIGRTAQLEQRMSFFEIKLPFATQLVCAVQSDDIVTLERQLHERYKDKHLNGEWFRLTEQDVKEIMEMARDVTYIKNILRLDAPDDWRLSKEPKSTWHHDSTYRDNDGHNIAPLMAKQEIACY